MSTFNEIDVECVECAEEYKGIIWTAIHASEDPVLKDILFGGELNILVCPKCARPAYQDHSVLYQDPGIELIAYIYPPSQSAEEAFLRKTTLASFHEAQNIYDPKDRKDYEPILVFGLATFVEMMEAEELREEQSQVAEAICKANHIPYFVLRPSEARRLTTARVCPGIKGDETSIVKGIRDLLAINPALNFYSKLAESLAVPATRLKP